jgi:Fe-S-cluster containining protein
MSQNREIPNNHCSRCGTCCSKGGPALHEEDTILVESGRIPLASLYTIRQGELARDNVSGGLTHVDSEIIKIKSIPDTNTCVYYDDSLHACRIYDHRPVECRALECWDTDAIIQIYAKHRLDRKGLLTSIPWVVELIQTHETRCSFTEIRHFVALREQGDPCGAEGLQRIVNDDALFRDMLIEKGKISPDMLDFLLGRPFADTLQLDFGIKVIEVNSGK